MRTPSAPPLVCSSLCVPSAISAARVEPDGGDGHVSKASMLSAILQSLPAAVCATDAEGRITFFNEGLVALFGRRPESGRARWEALPLSHPDGRPMRREESALARALAGGRAGARGGDGGAARRAAAADPLAGRAGPRRRGGLTGAVEVMLEADAAGRSGADRGRDRPGAAGGDRRLVGRRHHLQDARRRGDLVERRRHADLRLRAGGDDRPVDHSASSRPSCGPRRKAILARLRRGERVDHFDTVRVAKDGRRHLHLADRLAGAQRRRARWSAPRRSPATSPSASAPRSCSGCSSASSTTGSRTRSRSSRRSPGSRCGCEPSPSAFVASFTGRVQALARAHDILVAGRDAAGGARRPGARAGRSRRRTTAASAGRAEGGARLAHRAAAGAGAARARDERAQARRAFGAGGRLAIGWSWLATDAGEQRAAARVAGSRRRRPRRRRRRRGSARS